MLLNSLYSSVRLEQTNTSRNRHAMIRFSEITATLTSAWILTGEQSYMTFK